MPSHFNLFFTGVIIISSMDVFTMEEKYESWFDFKETTPLNTKFEFFDVENKIYTSNSGSLYILIVIIYGGALLRWIINKICLMFAKYKYPRMFGSYVYTYDNFVVRQAMLRLILESFFDITFCAFLNMMAFYDIRDHFSQINLFL